MAWTSPRTWSASELCTATLFNTHIRDNLSFLYDVVGGAQDYGANWIVAGARQLRWKDSGVAHGMTSVLPTDTYGAVQENTAAAGNLIMVGLGEGDVTGLTLFGVEGSATPTATTPAVQIRGDKRNGTTVQAVASTETLLQINTGGVVQNSIMGDGRYQWHLSGVAHGMTGILPTDVYAAISYNSPTEGQAIIYGMSDVGTRGGLMAWGIIGSATPTVTTPAITFRADKKNAASIQALGSTETVLQVQNGGTPLMTILGSGYVGVGTVTPTALITVQEGSTGAVQLLRSSADTNGGGLYLLKSRGTDSAPSALSANDVLGDVFFQGMRSGSVYETGALIRAEATVNWGAADLGTELSFWTVTDGATVFTKRAKFEKVLGDFAPATDLGNSLGNATFRWSKLFLGQYVEFSEMAAPGVSPANGARLYAVDNGAGKTQLVVIFSSGAAQVLATQP